MTIPTAAVRIKTGLLHPKMAVDTTFLIEALDRPDTDLGRRNKALWDAILASGGMILIPTPALAEFVVKKEWIPPRDTPRVRVVVFDQRAALLINAIGDDALRTKVKGDRNLVRMDALNVATAKRWGASCFLCADTDRPHVPKICEALELPLVRPDSLWMSEAEIAAEEEALRAEEAKQEALRKQKEAEKEAAKGKKTAPGQKGLFDLSDDVADPTRAAVGPPIPIVTKEVSDHEAAVRVAASIRAQNDTKEKVHVPEAAPEEQAAVQPATQAGGAAEVASRDDGRRRDPQSSDPPSAAAEVKHLPKEPGSEEEEVDVMTGKVAVARAE